MDDEASPEMETKELLAISVSLCVEVVDLVMTQATVISLQTFAVQTQIFWILLYWNAWN